MDARDSLRSKLQSHKACRKSVAKHIQMIAEGINVED